MKRKIDDLCRWLAWALPRRVVMWSAYRVLAHATVGQYGNEHPDDVSALEAVRRWGVR